MDDKSNRKSSSDHDGDDVGFSLREGDVTPMLIKEAYLHDNSNRYVSLLQSPLLLSSSLSLASPLSLSLSLSLSLQQQQQQCICRS